MNKNFAAVAAAAVLAVGMIGCGQEQPAQYPAPMNGGNSAPMSGNMGTALKVPAGASLIAASGYPILPFTAPGTGTVFVYDNDADKVALVTSVSGQQQVDLSQMQSANSTLDPKHQYRVYFVSSAHATTLRSSLGQ